MARYAIHAEMRMGVLFLCHKVVINSDRLKKSRASSPSKSVSNFGDSRSPTSPISVEAHQQTSLAMSTFTLQSCAIVLTARVKSGSCTKS